MGAKHQGKTDLKQGDRYLEKCRRKTELKHRNGNAEDEEALQSLLFQYQLGFRWLFCYHGNGMTV